MHLPLDLTIVIPVKNEEKNLPGCIKAIGTDFAKSVVVVDSGSTDDTSKNCIKFECSGNRFQMGWQVSKKKKLVSPKLPDKKQVGTVP